MVDCLWRVVRGKQLKVSSAQGEQLKVNWGGRAVGSALLAAVVGKEEGYRTGGYPKRRATVSGEKATGKCWRWSLRAGSGRKPGGSREAQACYLLKGLSERGLRGVRLVTSDDHSSIRQAVTAELFGVRWQRCVVRFGPKVQTYSLCWPRCRGLRGRP